MKPILRFHQSGFEAEQARIGIEVARKWIWPYAYDEEDLLAIHAQPGFDPETRISCFVDGQMVGSMYTLIKPAGEDGVVSAYLDFPRMLPGHEAAADLLVEKALDTLRRKGVSRVFGHVTTMAPGDIRLAEKMGFILLDWGFKVYYSYEMASGALDFPAERAVEIDPQKDLEQCAQIAVRWYGQESAWCLNRLKEWHERGMITHQGVWEGGRLAAACMAAPNLLRPSTAAIYYIYTPNEALLKPMLVNVVNRCVAYGVQTLIADLINEHRQYEAAYAGLGFKKAAEWARWEKAIA